MLLCLITIKIKGIFRYWYRFIILLEIAIGLNRRTRFIDFILLIWFWFTGEEIADICLFVIFSLRSVLVIGRMNSKEHSMHQYDIGIYCWSNHINDKHSRAIKSKFHRKNDWYRKWLKHKRSRSRFEWLLFPLQQLSIPCKICLSQSLLKNSNCGSTKVEMRCLSQYNSHSMKFLLLFFVSNLCIAF